MLAGANGHLTVDQIAREVDRHNPPPVNLASIYRALDLFSTLGLARETRLGGEGGARWELAHPDDEFHLVCSSCGRVEHHGGALVESIRNHLQVDHSFQVVDVELAVTGHCSKCAAG